MSRDLVETGLGWSWTARRVLASLADRDTSVVVAHDAGKVIGFGIARFRTDEAHILLLAVDRQHRRRGVGTALVKWFERSALVAGIGLIYLEARLSNAGARSFYRMLGYTEFKLETGRYRGREAGVRLGRDLWA